MRSRPLFIFDCDGVLVDSEPLANAILASHLQAAGVNITVSQTLELFRGRSAKLCIEKISEWLGRDSANLLWRELQAATLTALQQVQPIAGIESVLRWLTERELLFCVASAGDYGKMQVTLGATRILEQFAPALFSAVDVAHSKPAPDLFLHAARTLQSDPACCVVIEDSALGVEAGLAAGMRVFWYLPACQHESAQGRFQHGGDRLVLFDDMLQLPAHLATLLESWA